MCRFVPGSPYAGRAAGDSSGSTVRLVSLDGFWSFYRLALEQSTLGPSTAAPRGKAHRCFTSLPTPPAGPSRRALLRSRPLSRNAKGAPASRRQLRVRGAPSGWRSLLGPQALRAPFTRALGFSRHEPKGWSLEHRIVPLSYPKISKYETLM